MCAFPMQLARIDRQIVAPGPAEVRGHRADLVAAMLAGFGGCRTPANLYAVDSVELNPLRHGIDTVADVTPIPLTGKLVSNVSTNGSHAAVSSP